MFGVGYAYDPFDRTVTRTEKAGAAGEETTRFFTGVDKPDPANPDKKPYNTYRFNAKRLDPATGDYDMGARDYSPERNR